MRLGAPVPSSADRPVSAGGRTSAAYDLCYWTSAAKSIMPPEGGCRGNGVLLIGSIGAKIESSMSICSARLPCSAGSDHWLNRYVDPEEAWNYEPNDVPAPIRGRRSGLEPATTLKSGFCNALSPALRRLRRSEFFTGARAVRGPLPMRPRDAGPECKSEQTRRNTSAVQFVPVRLYLWP